MTQRATDVAKAVNMLLDLSGDDQEALLDVIQDYFCDLCSVKATAAKRRL